MHNPGRGGRGNANCLVALLTGDILISAEKENGRGGQNMFGQSLMRPRCQLGLVALLLAVALPAVAAEESSAPYFVPYPVAEQFCPPVDGFFDEVQRTMDRVRGHTFRHQPNGGYGLAVVDKIGDANLLH